MVKMTWHPELGGVQNHFENSRVLNISKWEPSIKLFMGTSLKLFFYISCLAAPRPTLDH